MVTMVVTVPPRTPCVRCNQSHDTPAAFLMACAKCERAWHHKCHIPPVTEQEIIDRINADEQGKRLSGLAAWQCRRCTKKQRIDAIPTDPPRPANYDADALLNVSSTEPEGDSSDGLATSRQQITAALPQHAQRKSSIQVDLDNDVEVLESAPSSAIVKKSQPSAPVDAPKRAAKAAPQTFQRSKTPSKRSLSFPDRVHGDAASGENVTVRQVEKLDVHDVHSKAQAASYESASHGPREPLPTGKAASRRVVQNEPASQAHLQCTPPPIPQPTQSSHYYTKDIRELISELRAKGKLAPPPSIDYVLGRSDRYRQFSPRGVNSMRGRIDPHSESIDIEDVARKLDYPADRDVMDIDSSEHVAYPWEGRTTSAQDPHNIDDLYGDIAPAYRDRSPLPLPRRTVAPPYNHLLFAVQARRLTQNGPVGNGTAQGGVHDAGSRRPRKPVARQLQGKAMIDKRASALQFAICDYAAGADE